MSSEWVLRLNDGTFLIGLVEDKNAAVIELKNPSTLQKIYSSTELNRRRLDISQYIDNSVIYIERSAIAYWAKPKPDIK